MTVSEPSLPAQPRPAKTIILAFDGTAKQFGLRNTNVIKLFSLFEKDNPEKQVLYYQPGIGTYLAEGGAWSPTIKSVMESLDKAFAWYLDIHIMDGYRFLMKHYQEGDNVCMFGFSRGAYTARCLAGMLNKVGLLLQDNDQMVASAYERYLDTSTDGQELAKKFKRAFSVHCQIEFLGVWDTVASVGIITSKNLPFTANNSIIKTFRQALALDERRVKFRPNLWHEPFHSNGTVTSVVGGLADIATTVLKTCMRNQWITDVMSPPEARPTAVAPRPEDQHAVDNDHEATASRKTDVKEVWFVGGHSDVGGGHVDPNTRNRISDPPLAWMINQIIISKAPVHFDEVAFTELEKEGFEVQRPQRESSSAQDTGFAVQKVRAKWEMDDILEATNELDSDRFWWILEFIPFRHSTFQSDLNKWMEKRALNRGRGRQIWQPQMFIHDSVRLGRLVDYRARAEVMRPDAHVAFVDDFDQEVERAQIENRRLQFRSKPRVKRPTRHPSWEIFILCLCFTLLIVSGAIWWLLEQCRIDFRPA